MDVRVDPAAMQELVTKAIFDGMTEEARSTLVRDAIKSLLNVPEKTGYGVRDPKSALQQAFEHAANVVATQIARDKLQADPTFAASVESLFQDVARKLFADDIREKVVAKICDAIVAGLGERYR